MADRSLFMAEVRVLKRQISCLRQEVEDRGYKGRYKEFEKEASLYGFVFPSTGKGRDYRLYYEAFDKDRLPAHLIDYFNLCFRITRLVHKKDCLIWQRNRLAKERRREMQNTLFGALGLTKAQCWLRSTFVRHGGHELPRGPLEGRGPLAHLGQADVPTTAAAELLQVHAEIQLEDRPSDLECPICMDADADVQLQDCRHRMCISCARAVSKMPHPHCPFCRGRFAILR